MSGNEKIQAQKQMIEELETQAAIDLENIKACLETLKLQQDVEIRIDGQWQEQEPQGLNVRYSYLYQQYGSLLQRLVFLLNSFGDVKRAIPYVNISVEANKIAQPQIKAFQEKIKTRIGALESENKKLREENKIFKQNNAGLNKSISNKHDQIKKLEATLVRTQTTDIRKPSTKVAQRLLNTPKDASNDEIKAIREKARTRIEALKKENKKLRATSNSSKHHIKGLKKALRKKKNEIKCLENRVKNMTTKIKNLSSEIENLKIAKDASDKAWKESRNVLQEMQVQHSTEDKWLEDDRNHLREKIEMLKEKFRKEEGKTTKEEIDQVSEKKSVQPRIHTEEEDSFAVFIPLTIAESNCKLMVKAEGCNYRYGLDISNYDVVAVVNFEDSVYLYSEVSEVEEKLCTCQYKVYCLAWNQQGTLLAIGGSHEKSKNNTIQVWDIPARNITKSLKIRDTDENCYCLDWKGDTVTAGTDNYIYQWNINDLDNDQDIHGNEALLPINAVYVEFGNSISTVQWSNCKSKLAAITEHGNMCIYDEQLNLSHKTKAYDGKCYALLQWCPWDNEVIATCCTDVDLKVWRVQQGITLITEVRHEYGVYNIKWIPSENAIITADNNQQLILWEYPSLRALRTLKGHTDIPCQLALNADKSAIISRSSHEIIFWEPFDEFEIQSASQEGTSTEEGEDNGSDDVDDVDSDLW
eukprot:CAMPEP_0175050084 /NCGR_PEP_ID=MMETSP0052_2-20121109/7075_1 /TAXON_ID=51329 ORGANISM="Polytomella parva, Strain SAG 63-3" /NCGR_SAMPLE_ID=MMETSP0052_2 /ASSEMBLY_ACC=CAM_ASM_000194 /LENGTH=696 /DNA_ID=CAMNT_0016314273 /DNA_START=282 /DNA_END=2372 /DNA_ORIENTATION=-